MSFVHHDLGHQSAGAIVEIAIDTRANVMLVDSTNHQRYRRRERFTYHGGNYDRSPIRLEIPHAAHWHVAIDLGGASGRIRSNARVFTQHAA
jgi:hypothetical protein